LYRQARKDTEGRKGRKMTDQKTQTTPAVTEQSMALFLAYAADAGNWSGMPYIGYNVGGSKEDRGNLTQLKRAGLIETERDEFGAFVIFTAAGKALAAANGVEI